jgi:hypothetical protein
VLQSVCESVCVQKKQAPCIVGLPVTQHVLDNMCAGALSHTISSTCLQMCRARLHKVPSASLHSAHKTQQT